MRALPLALLFLGASACGGAEPQQPASPNTATTAPPPPPPAADPAAPAAATGAAPAAANEPWPFGSTDDKAAQLERLKKDPGPIKSNWTPPGKADRYGHAEALMNAPPDVVRSKIVDFEHYKDLAGPKFKNVRVVDKQGAATDVYFQLPIMKGVVTIWYITRFAPPKNDVLDGTFVKGNIKNMHMVFTVRPGVDEKTTAFMCDLVLQPNVPAPQSALDEELRDACGDAVNAIRKKL